jgi:hypothetical protein
MWMRGPKTYRIRIAQLQFAKDIDRSLEVLQSAIADYSGSIESFNFAKETSKKMRSKRR